MIFFDDYVGDQTVELRTPGFYERRVLGVPVFLLFENGGLLEKLHPLKKELLDKKGS